MNIGQTLRRSVTALLATASLLVSPLAMSFTVDTTGSAITGLWYNANESGWGVTLTHQYDVMFVTMFVYDNTGNPIWYVASGCAVSGAGCSGPLYKVTGGQTATTTWNGLATAASVGTVTLAFTDTNTGTMSYTINGANGSKAITRQVFRTSPQPAPVNLSSLNGQKSGNYTRATALGCIAYGASTNDESASGNFTVTTSTSGSTADVTLYASGSYFDLTLNYTGGNSSTGFSFTGTVIETIRNWQGTVTVQNFRGTNAGTSYYDVAGFISITLPGGCVMSFDLT